MKQILRAYHLGKRINLKEVRNNFSYEILKQEHSFILFKIDEQSYCYIKDYGSIVFLNVDEGIIQKAINLITNENVQLHQFPNETYFLIEDKNRDIKVDFDTIYVNDVTIDIAHILMLNLAQSVALDYYYQLTSSLFESNYKYSNQLEKTGNISLSRKEMKKFIGRTINIKNNIADNLFIFDTSSLAWSLKELADLDYQIREQLEIKDRYHGLQHNLDVVKENLDLFKDILQHKHSSTLEWIIIILILFEIIHLLIEKII